MVIHYRSAYTIRSALKKGLSESSESSSDEVLQPPQRKKPCKECLQCAPVLSKLLVAFEQHGKHTVQQRRKRLMVYPYPKKQSSIPYRNLVQQNRWLRDNLFDSQGNYIYCSRCILKHLNVHSERLSHQRKIKRQLAQKPIVEKTKKEVENEHLMEWVMAPEGVDCSFTQYWSSLGDEDIVSVMYPHERHGLCGKPSNHAKTNAKEAFKKFVENNIQPNGRHAGSYSPQYFFLPQFTRIEPPKDGEANFAQKAKASVVAEFNRTQTEEGQPGISGITGRRWLAECFPKAALCPAMTDYCDTCKSMQEEMRRIRTTRDRLHQSGSAEPAQIHSLEAKLEEVEKELKHKETASDARAHYRDVTLNCKDEWNTICRLQNTTQRSTSEMQQLEEATNTFCLVLSADYQQSKLVPHWDATAQPGLSYYLQKVSHDILGIVDHRNEKATIYIFDERFGPKSTDHTISFLDSYITQIQIAHPWMKRFCIFLDNAASTNKNKFMLSWCYEMVSQRKADFIRVCFLTAGHTKFAPDRIFASISHSYNHSDVFNVDELKVVCSQHATAVVDDGNGIFDWRSTIDAKYKAIPGVRTYHDFHAIRTSPSSDVLFKVRGSICTGHSSVYPLVINSAALLLPNSNYYDKKKSLSEQKLSHMQTMYGRWIDPDRWPVFLPTPPLSTTVTSEDTGPPRADRSTRRKMNCSVAGCDGTGHKNPAKWEQGHTTRAGCPIFHAQNV